MPQSSGTPLKRIPPSEKASRPPKPQVAALPNVDERLRKAVAAFRRMNPKYWDFRDATGRIEAHAYYQYPAMMVPSMQRALLQTVLKLQRGIRDLVDPF